MWKFTEHAYLLLSHVNPTVRHHNTPECLICRHRYTAAKPRSPHAITYSAAQRYPSENELLATNNFSPKCLTYSQVVASGPLVQQLRYTFNILNYADAGLACSLTRPGRAAELRRIRNAVVVVGAEALPNHFATSQQLVLFLSGGSWVQCDKLIVLGLKSGGLVWNEFVRAVKTTLEKTPIVQHALFVHLGTLEHSKNFMSWLQHTNGKVSHRTLLQHQLLQFDVWASTPNWDIALFV